MSGPEAGALALATNQRRARGLRQVAARQLLATDDVMATDGVTPLYYQFTLHVSADAEPLYSSEPHLSAAAVWEPLHLEPLLGRAANATQLVVRVVARRGRRAAEILSWAVTLAALVPVSLRWTFQPNTLLFRFGSVWLTAAECVAERRTAPAPPLAVTVPEEAVGLAARGPQLERLHRCQRERRRLETAVEALTEEGSALWPAVEWRRRAAAGRDQLRRRLALLRADTAARRAAVHEARRQLEAARARRAASSAQLSRQWDELREDCASLAEWRIKFASLHGLYVQAHGQLAFRRRELCNELQLIYPLRRSAEGYTVQGVHLPNAEEYSLAPDRSVSVALSHVSHLVVMVAWLLGVCLRYPIRQRDAHPVIVDHIVAGLPDGERQFPLHVSGRDSLSFNYAVYLLNKNIAQLRQHCGLETTDLRAMLPNLASLLTDGVAAPGAEEAAAGTGAPAAFWPCGPPPAPRGREQLLRLPAGIVTLREAVTDGRWQPEPAAVAVAGPSPADSGAACSDDGEEGAEPAERARSPDSAASAGSAGPAAGEELPAEPALPNGVEEPPPAEEAPPPPPAPPPSAPGDSPLYGTPSDDTDWDYVTSRMQILAKPKSFKLISKREGDDS